MVSWHVQGFGGHDIAARPANATLQTSRGPLHKGTATTTALQMYYPRTLATASHTALQSISQAAQAAGKLGTAAGAHSLQSVQYAAHRSAVNMVAAYQVMAKLSHMAVDETCRIGHDTGVALYTGFNETATSIRYRLGTAQLAVAKAGHATAAAFESFGSDIALSAKTMLQDAPLVVTRMREDLGVGVEGAHHMIKHAGAVVRHGVSHVAHQVSTGSRLCFSC